MVDRWLSYAVVGLDSIGFLLEQSARRVRAGANRLFGVLELLERRDVDHGSVAR